MRTAAPLAFAALVAFGLSGCVAEEDEPANPLFGLCPQWEMGPTQQAGTVVLNETANRASQIVAPADMHMQGHAFDMVRIRIDAFERSAPTVNLSAFNETGAQLIWRDFRPQQPQVVPVIVFQSGDEKDHVFETYLTSVSHDDAARPGTVQLHWSMEGTGSAAIFYTATFHYKVCGAAVGAA